MSTVIMKMPKKKASEFKELVEDGLRVFGKVMQCLEDCYDEDESYGERNDYEDEDALEHMRRLDRFGAREGVMGYRRNRRTGRFM